MALYLRTVEERLKSNTQSFLYKWTHIPTKKWYVGSRTAAKVFGCSAPTIRKWSRNMVNGWKFKSKDMV